MAAATPNACWSYLAAHDESFGSKQHRFTVLTVVAPIPSRAAGALNKKIVHDYYAEEAEATFKPIRAFFAKQGVDAEFEHRVGNAGEQIAAVARKGKFDLVMMGSHGHGALARMVGGLGDESGAGQLRGAAADRSLTRRRSARRPTARPRSSAGLVLFDPAANPAERVVDVIFSGHLLRRRVNRQLHAVRGAEVRWVRRGRGIAGALPVRWAAPDPVIRVRRA